MMMTAFDISASALVAQRVRMDTISSNLANMSYAVPAPEPTINVIVLPW